MNRHMLLESLIAAAAPALPNKGDIIKLDVDSTRYRVLKISGTVAEILSLKDITEKWFNKAGSSTTTTFSDGSTGQKYEGSALDNYMNSTFYNSLSTVIKNAIVKKSITQSIYQIGSSEISGYDFKIARITVGTRWYDKKGQVTVGNRYCYALDIDDIAEYFAAGSGSTVSGANINYMFYEQTTSVSKDRYVWLASAVTAGTDYAFIVDGYYADVDYLTYYYSRIGRPAFQVDLSKITWTKE